MTPEGIAMLIAALTDTAIRVAAQQKGITYEEMKAAVERLQPKADELEVWLRNKGK